MKSTIVLTDQRYLNHLTMPGHPESPERLKSIYAMLDQEAVRDSVERVQPREATPDEICMNHTREYPLP